MGPTDDQTPGESLPPPTWDPPTVPAGQSQVGPLTPVSDRRARGMRGRVVGVLAIVVVLLGASIAVVNLGGDSAENVSGSTTVTTLATEGSTVTTEVPPETYVLTTPPAESTTTDVETPDGDLVTDDLGAFSVVVPTAMERATDPAEIFGLTFARVSASNDLAAYRADDVTIGYTVIATLLDESGLTQRSMLDELALGQTSCDLRQPSAITSPTFGIVDVELVDGCGPDKGSAKVGLAVEIEGNLLLCLFIQGPGPSDGPLLEMAVALLESVTVIG